MMDCKKCIDLMDAYIDDELNEEELTAFNQHTSECEACRNELSEMQALQDMLKNLPELDLPEEFSSELRIKLESESVEKSSTKFKSIEFLNKYKFALGSVAATLLIAVMVTSGGYDGFEMSKSASEDSEVYETAMVESKAEMDYGTSEKRGDTKSMVTTMAAPMVENVMADESIALKFNEAVEDSNGAASYTVVMAGSDDGVSTEASETSESPEADQAKSTHDNLGRLIIHNGSLTIETEDFEAVKKSITENTLNLGGFILNSNYNVFDTYQNNKEIKLNRGHLTLRVPAEYFYSFFDDLGTLGLVVNTSTYSDDITSNYRDTVSEIENLKLQEERLREILKTAKTVEDVLNVERELSRIRSQINQYEGTVKNWDRLIKMSTINVELIEVVNIEDSVKPIDENVFEKAKKGFVRSINRLIALSERLFIKAVSMIPVIISVGVLFLIGFIVYKIIKKRRN